MIVNQLSIDRMPSHYKVLALLWGIWLANWVEWRQDKGKSSGWAGATAGYNVYVYTETHRSGKLSVNHSDN